MSDSSTPHSDYRDRAFDFAVQAVALSRTMARSGDDVLRVVARQFVRAATSVGANIEESRAAESDADFVHKLRIAQKELRECCYWLRLINASALVPSSHTALLVGESHELLRIVAAIVVKVSRRIGEQKQSHRPR